MNRSFISFNQAKVGLRRFERRRINLVLDLLKTLESIFVIYRAILKSYPASSERYLKKLADLQVECVVDGRDLDHVVEEIISVLAGLFPLQEDWMYQCWLEEPAEAKSITVAAEGPYLIDDDFIEFLENPQEFNNSPYWTLMMFLICLDKSSWIDTEEKWPAIQQHFGWPTVDLARLPDTYYIDLRRFRKELTCRGLGRKGFDVAQRMVWRCTGNYFFDFEPESMIAPALELNALLELIEEGKQAVALATKIEPALKMVAEDPQILSTVYEAYVASAAPRCDEGDKNG